MPDAARASCGGDEGAARFEAYPVHRGATTSTLAFLPPQIAFPTTLLGGNRADATSGGDAAGAGGAGEKAATPGAGILVLVLAVVGAVLVRRRACS